MSDNQKRYTYQQVKDWFSNKFPEYGKGEWVEYDGFSLKLEVNAPTYGHASEYYLDSCKIKFDIFSNHLNGSERSVLERGQYKITTVTKEKINERIEKIKAEVNKIKDSKKQFDDYKTKKLELAKKLIKEAFPNHDLKVVEYGQKYLAKKGEATMFNFLLSNNQIEAVNVSLGGTLESLKKTIEFKIWRDGQ